MATERTHKLPIVQRTPQYVWHLFGPLISARQHSSGWRLVSWDHEQGISLVFARGTTVILIEFERANPAVDCYARTRLFNVCARTQFSDTPDLCQEGRSLADAIVRYVAKRERALPEQGAAAGTRAMVREIQVERVLIPEGAGRYYLNPYAGCMIGCSYCYVAERAAFSRQLEGVASPPWGKWVDVKVNAPEVLRREVTDMPPGLVRMSPILTDPYQALERRYRITRRCLEVMAPHGFRPVILTRESRLLEDLDLLESARAAVGFSIPTDNDELRKRFEPGADCIENRFRALEACSAAGLTTCVVVQPTLPMDVKRFVERLAPHIQAARVDRLHFGDRVRALFERAGMPWAASDSYQEELVGRLTEEFNRAGVLLDENDDLTGKLEASLL